MTRRHPPIFEEEPFRRLLRSFREDHRRALAELQDLGFTLRGNLELRRLPCGKAGCRCRTSGKGHGPYYQLTWNEGGKTASRFLHPTLVPLYRAWLENGRSLDRAVERLIAVSRKAADAVRAEEAERAKAAKVSGRHRKGR